MTSTTDEKTKPIHARSGSVTIPLWPNVSKDGEQYLSPDKPEFRYRDKDGNWQTTDRPRAGDLLYLARAAIKAQDMVDEHRQAKSKINASLGKAA